MKAVGVYILIVFPYLWGALGILSNLISDPLLNFLISFLHQQLSSESLY